MKHTQGEWKLEGRQINALTITGRKTVAHVAPEDSVEQQANAKLIAAAPDLLEALEICIKLLYECGFNSNDDQIAEAEAAIKKATK